MQRHHRSTIGAYLAFVVSAPLIITSAVVFAVVGPILWIPFVVRSLFSYASLLLTHAAIGQPETVSTAALEGGVRWYFVSIPRILSHLGDPFEDPSAPRRTGAGADAMNFLKGHFWKYIGVLSFVLAKQTLWAAVFWIGFVVVLAHLGLTPAQALIDRLVVAPAGGHPAAIEAQRAAQPVAAPSAEVAQVAPRPVPPPVAKRTFSSAVAALLPRFALSPVMSETPALPWSPQKVAVQAPHPVEPMAGPPAKLPTPALAPSKVAIPQPKPGLPNRPQQVAMAQPPNPAQPIPMTVAPKPAQQVAMPMPQRPAQQLPMAMPQKPAQQVPMAMAPHPGVPPRTPQAALAPQVLVPPQQPRVVVGTAQHPTTRTPVVPPPKPGQPQHGAMPEQQTASLPAPNAAPPPAPAAPPTPRVVLPPTSTGSPHVCSHDYPADAARRGEEGVSSVAFSISSEGTVSDISVANSSGSAGLDEAAMQCVARWRYSPATSDGQPVAIRWRADVRWTLH